MVVRSTTNAPAAADRAEAESIIALADRLTDLNSWAVDGWAAGPTEAEPYLASDYLFKVTVFKRAGIEYPPTALDGADVVWPLAGSLEGFGEIVAEQPLGKGTTSRLRTADTRGGHRSPTCPRRHALHPHGREPAGRDRLDIIKQAHHGHARTAAARRPTGLQCRQLVAMRPMSVGTPPRQAAVAAQADRDGRRGLARLGGQLRDAPRREPEGRAPDVDGGDDVAAGVVDRRRDRVEPELVLADRRRVAAPADPGQLLEQRLELDDRPLGVADEAAPDDAQDLALGERRRAGPCPRRRSGAASPARSSRRRR